MVIILNFKKMNHYIEELDNFRTIVINVNTKLIVLIIGHVYKVHLKSNI